MGLLIMVLLAISHNALAGAQDDPLLTMIKIDQLEKRSGDEDCLVFSEMVFKDKSLLLHLV
jgi:hypothetical protein